QQMIVGRNVTIAASFKSAEEDRDTQFYALYLIAEKAALVSGDPAQAPAPAFTSYIVCQPPQLDALTRKLGNELCVQNTLLPDPGTTSAALEAAASTPAIFSPADTAPGDAAAITCYRDRERSDINLPAIACAKN